VELAIFTTVIEEHRPSGIVITVVASSFETVGVDGLFAENDFAAGD
jgi:hypothetical protein